MTRTTVLRCLLVAALLLPVVGRPVAAQTTAPAAEVVVVLVRHAEKADDSRDPSLSAAGEARAAALGAMLRDAGLSRVWSTPFLRTRGTAAPVAARAGLPVESYDAGDLRAFATRLLATPGRHLVVGHSNTTPGLVKALGGDPQGTIADDDYDRLYVVSAGPAGVTSVLLRYPGP